MRDSELTSNIEAVIIAWKKKPAVLLNAMEKGLQDGMRLFEGQRIIKAQLSGRRGNDYGLKRGTGNAANAINLKMYREGLDRVGVITVGERAWYLKVHQHYNFNGYIKPKNATLLAIPVNPAARGKRPREMDLVFIKSPGKNPILVSKDGFKKNGGIKKGGVMFVLKPQVYIPKRLYFYEEFNTIGKNMIKTKILERLEAANNAE